MKAFKKIINGKMYNTETAKELADYWNGYHGHDFGYTWEYLFIKKTGEYFLYGEGGALSRYAEHVAGGSVFGRKIIPMTEKEAQEWVMEHCDADTYIKLFGEVEE